MKRLKIEHLRDRQTFNLSGGEKQKIALAGLLAMNPSILLLDEPLSALDAPLRRELCSQLSRTLRELGKIAILVTHDLSEAFQIADTVVLYEQGRTTNAMLKNDLLWNPSSERVARLIGARNILRAPIAGSTGDSILLDWRGATLQAARSPSAGVSAAHASACYA